jgi:hypothetical protein
MANATLKAGCGIGLVLALLGGAGAAPLTGGEGDQLWALREHRAGELTARIDGDIVNLSPEAARSLDEQIKARKPIGDAGYTVKITVGRDPLGRPLVTGIAIVD